MILRDLISPGWRRAPSARIPACLFVVAVSALCLPAAEPADLILHQGKVVTVDPEFSLAEAIAVKGERIVAVGRSADVLRNHRGGKTELVDLNGGMLLPGLMDSHVHPRAALVEFDHELPTFETIADVLEYIRERAKVVPKGKWIYLRQVFITRLKEQRYPTKRELDDAAPEHPVAFATGPDTMLNSLGLKECGVDKDFRIPDDGPGHIYRDEATGEPTGMTRGVNRLLKIRPHRDSPNDRQTYDLMAELFRDYASVGLTAVADRNASVGSFALYEKLYRNGDLPVRLALSAGTPYLGPFQKIQDRIRDVAEHPLFVNRDPHLRIVGLKVFLDGGMLTGSAYMRRPWGISSIYGITDPDYRGVRNIPHERLVALVRTAVENGLQFTAHSVGDGAVHGLLDAYEEVNRERPIGRTRPCITHSNFMSREAVEQAARLGVLMDIQPAWLYLDARTLENQFGYERLRWFQPLRTIFETGGTVGGGSDHMQKIGSLRSVNPYNPFLGMWITVTRKAKWYDGRLHPEEALDRERMIRMYTINNAKLLFLEKETGSLEPGKRADFVVVDTDLLDCPDDAIRDTRVIRTYVDGRLVFRASRD